MILVNKLKAGDILELEQEDGNVIIIHVYPNTIMIKAKAAFPGTRLEVIRGSSAKWRRRIEEIDGDTR